MSGNPIGGKKAAQKIKEQDPDFYKRIGQKGGQISRGGGFASNKVGADGLTGRERSRIAGKMGGAKSKRRKVEQA